MSSQTFRSRLPEVVDQAQHFASITTATAGAGSADPSSAFREGLDGTERERKYLMMHEVDPDADLAASLHASARGRTDDEEMVQS